MRKIIAAFNMTLDGFCDHTAVVASEEMHTYYSHLLDTGGVALYGRTTYQLMEYWKEVLQNPTGEPSTDEFAIKIDRIPKVVFSHTLQSLDWASARLAENDLKEEVLWLREQPGDDILVCSRSLIVALINLGLLDELQLMVHPVLARQGLPMFEGMEDKKILKLSGIRTFDFGAVIHYYHFDT